MIEFRKADESNLIEIEKLADIIWKEHYTPIIGKEQVDYMLDKFQNASAMTQQIKEGYIYHTVKVNQELIGYSAIQFRNLNYIKECFISKIYLEKSQRGKGFGKEIFKFISQIAIENEAQLLKLTVNKYNSETIKMYHKVGFEIAQEAIFDIGNGYIMDDYELVKEL